jgi:predicted HicB family RNase H-like nuclease
MFNNPKHERLVKYAKRKGLSLYGLVKKVVREYVERHP